MQTRTEVSKTLISTIGGWPIFFAFIFPFGFYINKVVIWDICLGLGVTPAIKGDVAMWGAVIIGGVFGHSLGMNVLKGWLSK